jgi:hypothetical protein
MKIWLLKIQINDFEILDFSNKEEADYFFENLNGLRMGDIGSPITVKI